MIYAGLSEQGKRSKNEDSIYLPARGSVSLVAIADGMGGHNAGFTASRLAVETASECVKRGGGLRPGALLRKAAEEANSAIYEQARSDRACRGMGTTLVMGLLFRSRYTALNVGDSRLYHLRPDGLVQITKDHSYVAEMVAAGVISAEEARTHPQRNIITSALGARSIDKMDIFEKKWDEGDILMLCSDGLYGALEEREMERILREEGEDLQAACASLVQNALYGGSSDNISVVLVQNREVR